MSDFNVRTDAVDVDDIMRQIRARIRDKRGADYTDAEVSQLAQVKLEKLIDPKGGRADLVDQYRRRAKDGNGKDFTEDMLYATPKPWLRGVRRLFNPILRLFFDPAAVAGALQKEPDDLPFEVIHNLVVEVTRLGIDVHNLKMRVEALSSRVDFDERRARAMESTTPFRPPAPRPEPRRDQRPAPGPQPDPRTAQRPDPRQEVPQEIRSDAATDAGRADRPVATSEPGMAASPMAAGVTNPPDGERRRRRRRRRRRSGQGMSGAPPNAGGTPNGGGGTPSTSPPAPEPQPQADGAFDDDGPDDGPEE